MFYGPAGLGTSVFHRPWLLHSQLSYRFIYRISRNCLWFCYWSLCWIFPPTFAVRATCKILLQVFHLVLYNSIDISFLFYHHGLVQPDHRIISLCQIFVSLEVFFSYLCNSFDNVSKRATTKTQNSLRGTENARNEGELITNLRSFWDSLAGGSFSNKTTLFLIIMFCFSDILHVAFCFAYFFTFFAQSLRGHIYNFFADVYFKLKAY